MPGIRLNAPRFAIVTVMLAALIAAACGADSPEPTATSTSEPPATNTPTPDASSTETSGSPTPTAPVASPTAQPSATATQTSATPTQAVPQMREIEHTLGTTTIEGVPEKIVVLEWTYAEDLLALGIQPAGVADIDGMNNWVQTRTPLAESVVDVGTRQEPSLESIAALEPDLIIAVQFRHEAIYDTLSDLAPTLVFNPYPSEESGLTQYDGMEQTLLDIAYAVGQPEKGQQALDELHAYYEDAKNQIEAAGALDSQFLMVQAFTSSDVPTMRLFTDNAMAVQIFERIGLDNAYEYGYELYGFSTVGIEALSGYGNANLFYVVQADDDVFANQWADNPVWNSLEFVQEGRVYPMGGDTWLFGGPDSARLIVDKAVSALTGDAQ